MQPAMLAAAASSSTIGQGRTVLVNGGPDPVAACGLRNAGQEQASDEERGPTDNAEVFPSAAPPGPADVLAVVRRLAGQQVVPEALLAAIRGAGGAEAAAEDAGRTVSDTTRQAYRRDWVHFAAWCRDHGVDPAALPIHPVLAAAYLASLAGIVGRSALNSRVSAIAHEHRRHGLDWHAAHSVIRGTLRDLDRAHGKPARAAAVLTAAEIKQLVATCGDDTAGLRDRALLLVAFTGGLRRSELVGIDHAHLRFEASGVLIRLPRANADEVGLPRARTAEGIVGETCPVQALERWLARAHIRRGAVFRSVTAGGRLGDRLSPDGVRHILLGRGKLAGLVVPPGERLSPHGLRAGVLAERAARPSRTVR